MNGVGPASTASARPVPRKNSIAPAKGVPMAGQMKTAIEKIKAFDKTNHDLNVIIETPKGSRFKYVYTPKSGLFRVKRALPPGMVFPFNYGFIPSTRGADGDPLDIIIHDEPLQRDMFTD
jgi:inorganic pyrophosphatase